MAKTLVKCKIVKEGAGSIVIYFWKRTFLCFGCWYPFGCSAADFKRDFSNITDDAVSHVLFHELIAANSRYGN